MLTNRDILKIAMEQSALESGCDRDDFKKKGNVVVRSVINDKARDYLKLPYICDLTTYGNNIVASVEEKHEAFIRDLLDRYPHERLLEAPLVTLLDSYFRECDCGVCFQAAYYLPDIEVLKVPNPRKEFPFVLRVLERGDFDELYTEEWSYALSMQNRKGDVLGVGAYDGDGKLVGLAACSEDCDTMWQIGINVDPEHQGEGIAQTVTRELALRILARGIVPFYRSPWSNIASVRNALAAGFKPAWCQVTVKSREFIDRMITNLKETGRG